MAKLTKEEALKKAEQLTNWGEWQCHSVNRIR